MGGPFEKTVTCTLAGIERIRQAIYLCPVSGSIVVCSSTRRLRNVDLLRPWMSESLVQSKTKSVSGDYCVCLCIKGKAGGGAGITSHVCRVYVLEGLIGVVGFAYVLIRSANDFAIYDDTIIVLVCKICSYVESKANKG